MKNLIINGIIVLAMELLTPQITRAQGTLTYLSNLGQPSVGSEDVASNSWLAAEFQTGTDAGGYALNSIQLAMTDASGSPNGFAVMIYSQLTAFGASHPRTNIDTLNGSTDPSTAGIYIYTDSSNLILSPSTLYSIVLTSGIAVTNGAYEWSDVNTNSYTPVGGWVGGINNEQSANGLAWGRSSSIFPQFAIDATPTPEPSSSWLLLLGSGIFIYGRRAFRRHNKTS